ncbi:MAG: hypothetical protein HYY41_04600 [Chloroflexi bacterium]|nr:hypothetical protein [Chloroflexota bacterium]
MIKQRQRPTRQATASKPAEIAIASPVNAEAIRHLEEAIAGGQHWYIALLEAIGRWDTAEEIYNGRRYRYLIAGEAFDWLLLAERLCQAVDDRLPDNEKNALLFHGKPPLDLPERRFKELIGSIKYRQYLNYFYGVTVEEALIMAVQAEVRKEKRASGNYKAPDTTTEAYRRIYGATKAILLRRFRRDKGYPQLKTTTLTELKEFSYWLFQYRFKHSDKARVASDTRKALNWLKCNGFSRQSEEPDSKLESNNVPTAALARG